MIVNVGNKSWLWINLPTVHAVLGTSGAEVRMAAAVFNAAEQQRGAVGK